jgi:hypothetical protein
VKGFLDFQKFLLRLRKKHVHPCRFPGYHPHIPAFCQPEALNTALLAPHKTDAASEPGPQLMRHVGYKIKFCVNHGFLLFLTFVLGWCYFLYSDLYRRHGLNSFL